MGITHFLFSSFMAVGSFLGDRRALSLRLSLRFSSSLGGGGGGSFLWFSWLAFSLSLDGESQAASSFFSAVSPSGFSSWWIFTTFTCRVLSFPTRKSHSSPTAYLVRISSQAISTSLSRDTVLWWTISSTGFSNHWGYSSCSSSVTSCSSSHASLCVSWLLPVLLHVQMRSSYFFRRASNSSLFLKASLVCSMM